MAKLITASAGFFCRIVIVIAIVGQSGCRMEERATPTPTQSEEVIAVDWDALIQKSVEARLEDWVSDDSMDQMPMESIRDASIDVEGDWLVHRRMNLSSMTIHQQDAKRYSVEFHATGCLRQWNLQRTATYTEGVLTLDRPVKEYASFTYDRLYAVRIDGEECLVPVCNVNRLHHELDELGKPMGDNVGVRFFTFGRRAVRSPL